MLRSYDGIMHDVLSHKEEQHLSSDEAEKVIKQMHNSRCQELSRMALARQ
jgi:hypothetical protein